MQYFAAYTYVCKQQNMLQCITGLKGVRRGVRYAQNTLILANNRAFSIILPKDRDFTWDHKFTAADGHDLAAEQPHIIFLFLPLLVASVRPRPLIGWLNIPQVTLQNRKRF